MKKESNPNPPDIKNKPAPPPAPPKRKVGDVIERKPERATNEQLEKDLRKDRVR